MKSDCKKIIVTAAVVINKDMVLLTSRTDKATGELFWEFPGGKVEPGESLDMALRREMIEELGADVIVLDLIHHIEFDYPDKSVSLHFFRCLFKEQNPELHSHDGQLIQWVALRDIQQVNLLPADAPLADYLAQY